jgi:uncharacterized spore protein YtfJ
MKTNAFTKNVKEISALSNDSTGENFLKELPEQLGFAARSIKIYGEPIERAETTVIPVSNISYVFGGGFGGQKNQAGGGGGGGSLTTSPVGYIEIKNGVTKFHRIIDLQRLIPLIAAGSLTLLTVFWSVGKLIKISKKGDSHEKF